MPENWRQLCINADRETLEKYFPPIREELRRYEEKKKNRGQFKQSCFARRSAPLPANSKVKIEPRKVEETKVVKKHREYAEEKTLVENVLKPTTMS